MWVLLLLAIVIIFLLYRCESFTNKKEKAEFIYDWWNSNDNHNYNKYKKQVKKSNIVEYMDSLNLYHNNNLTVTNIENIL